MRKHTRWSIIFISAGLLLGSTLQAAAEHEDRPATNNLHPMGHIEEPASLINPEIANPNIHTDMAFWGKYAVQGSWLGFNIRDISAPGNPKPVSSTSCQGDQGDVVVWDDIVVRSWNSPASMGLTCDGQPVPEGFEGLHVFDVSDKSDPELVGSVELSGQSTPVGCGSHTLTAVPDLANDRLLIYNNSSSGACPWIDIAEVPLGNPADAELVRQVPTQRSCHDTGVILGDALLAACAGGNGFTVLELDPSSLDDPQFLYSKDVNEDIVDEGTVGVGHSASFTWDGEVLIFGHEPGGGTQARCREEDPDSQKSAFFFEAGTGSFLGMWTLPRPQEAIENCSIHVYNVVPTRSGQDVLVAGNYQAGTWVVDFTDPANAEAIAWSDPDPLPVVPGSPFCGGLGCDIGGAWSSYWYNNFIYETNITQGLNIFRFSGNEPAGALRQPHLNPQTQEFTIP
jgi:hypothetical protein